ncbi:MAG: hypothetical protein ACTH58_13250 [Marinomonas foliarum]|uniref:hypothetical protein n=1 Tax=Marinomonas foliarum TaxID=491950 RepID=UPI003F9BA89B
MICRVGRGFSPTRSSNSKPTKTLGFNPDFHLGAWSKPNTTARHCRLTSLLAFALLLAAEHKHPKM